MNLSPSQVDALDYAFKSLGGTLRPFNKVGAGEDPGWGSGQWSLVGVAGWTEGQATQSGSARSGPLKGNLKGYLQVGSKGLYDFVFGDYVRFDSAMPDPPSGTNRVMVGDQQHPSTPTIPAGQSGFQVVVLDQGTLGLAHNETFVTNTSADAADVIPEGAL
ncbi:MAG: hypothetical protein M3063_09815 [Actinomycetota bacterium]|nr:hypothetical protein [Actinomycetota bacterium]MDQ6948901.1 hypothetical protein [Actinomycetota bacterium]